MPLAPTRMPAAQLPCGAGDLVACQRGDSRGPFLSRDRKGAVRPQLPQPEVAP